MASEKVIYDSIAQKLLQVKCFGTALEFHHELSERGKVIPRLRDYFDSQDIQDNITKNSLRRTSSIQTLESLDFTRFSDDSSYQIEEKIAVLEYELRKANETIKLLRGNITQQTTGKSETLITNESQPVVSLQQNNPNPPIKCFEKRAINFLVNEYLITQGYRLSSVTFADENEDQDFEDWVDVGLSNRRPADLLSIIRSYHNPDPPPSTSPSPYADSGDKGVPEREDDNNIICSGDSPTRELFVAELDELRKRVTELTRQNVRLGEQARHFQKELERVLLFPRVNGDGVPKDESSFQGRSGDQVKILEHPTGRYPACPRDNVTCEGSDIGDIEIADRILEKSSKYMSSQFRKALLRKASPLHPDQSSSDGTTPISHLTRVTRMAESCEELVDVLARSLPNIFPNVLITKREELIPLLLSAAHLHLDTKVRDTLLHVLFNLVKRPDQNQRRVILVSCLKYAQSAGPTRINLELLPQCWEQISHKHPERRLLIAETCGLLAPYVLEDIRESLLLSMLQQLFSEERDPIIRSAVLKSLSLIFPFVRDKDKLTLALEIVNQALFQADDNEMYHVTKDVFLPALAVWTAHLGLLQTSLTLHFNSRLESTVKSILGLDKEVDVSEKDEMDKMATPIISPNQKASSKTILIRGKPERDLLICLSCLEALIPFLYHSALVTGPYNGSADENSPAPTQPDDSYTKACSSDGKGGIDKGNLMPPLNDIRLLTRQSLELEELKDSFESLVKEEWYLMWHELGFLIQTLLPTLIKCALLIEVDQTSHILRHYFCSFFRTFVFTFGSIFVNSKVEPIFSAAILALVGKEGQDNGPVHNSFTKLIIPIYVVGILDAANSYPDLESTSKAAIFLKDLIVSLSLANTSTKSARASIQELCQFSSQDSLPILTTILSDLASHSMASVRVSAAKLATEVIPYVAKDVKHLSQHFTLLRTLSSDMDLTVKMAAVESLGTVIQYIPPPFHDNLDKDYVEILKQSFAVFYAYLRNPYGSGEESRFAPQVIRLLGHVGTDTECSFVRESYIIPCLAHVITACNVQIGQPRSSQGSTKISGILSALFQALSTISCCDNSQAVIREYFLPALVALKEDSFSLLTPDHEKVLNSMIRDQEAKLKAFERAGRTKGSPLNPDRTNLEAAVLERSPSTKSPGQNASSNQVRSGYFGLEGGVQGRETGGCSNNSNRLPKMNDLKGEITKLHTLGNIFTRKKS